MAGRSNGRRGQPWFAVGKPVPARRAAALMALSFLLPFGVRTAEEEGIENIPGQAESAPANFRPGRLLIRATALAIVLTSLFVLNYEMGWITAADLDFMPKPPEDLGTRQ